jgi:hypothetical protein
MDPIKVYADQGGYDTRMKELIRSGTIEVVGFPHDPPRDTQVGSADSLTVTGDVKHLTAESNAPGGDTTESDRWVAIASIVGSGNEYDIRQIDSAYTAGCRAFFTTDERQILERREALEDLLGMRFFHPSHEWEEFLAFIGVTGAAS